MGGLTINTCFGDDTVEVLVVVIGDDFLAFL